VATFHIIVSNMEGALVNLKLWQVDAFAEKPLEGNPAAIVPLT